MKKTSQPEIDSLSHFRQEFSSLLEDFESNISSIARYERTEMDGPTVKLVEKLNTLKLHRKKLKDMLNLYGEMEEEKWPDIRPEAQRVFEAARKQYLESSKEISLG